MSKTTVPKHDFYRAAKLSLLNFLSLLRDLQNNYSGISKSRRDSVGGGGSSRVCPCSPKADAIQWGRGSSRIFLGSPEADAIQWGGVVAGFVSVISETRHHSVGGGGSNIFSIIFSCEITFLPHIERYSWVETHILG